MVKVRKSNEKIEAINWGVSNDNQIRLLWGENNVEMPQKVKSAMIAEIQKSHKYPDPTKLALREKLAKYNQVNANNLLIGNGSDEIIEIIAKTYLEEGEEVITPIPTFPTYANVAYLMGGVVNEIQLEKDFSLDINKIIKAITPKTKVIFIANPNNPTGNMLVSEKEIRKILSVFKGLLVIDECYFEIAGKTVLPLIKEYDNLLILRSFSKSFALAGLRVGYGAGNEKIIAEMNKISNTLQPFNVNRFALIAAETSLDFAKEMKDNFLKLKNDFSDKLQLIKGIKIVPTSTTFIILDLSNTSLTGAEFKKKMIEKDILVKDCGIYKGFGANYAYLGIPRKEDFKQVLDAINSVLK